MSNQTGKASKNAIIIAIANQKGGVSKTTTTLNLAAAMVAEGCKVAVVDVDPQSNLTSYLGHEPDGLPGIADLMAAVVEGQRPDALEYIRHNPEGIAYIPSSMELAGAEMLLSGRENWEVVLKQVLDGPIINHFDYILLDCLPSLGMLLVNALVACDSVLIPLQMQKLAYDGLDSLVDIIHATKRNHNPTLDIVGILPTMYKKRAIMSRAVESALQQDGELCNKVFDTAISDSVDASTSSYLKKSLLATKSRLGDQYREAARELLQRSGWHGPKD